MALRGETIGRAYVKILADGSNMPQSIKEGLSDKRVTDAVKSEGRHHGEIYGDAMKEGIGDQKIGDELRKQLELGAAKSDLAAKYFNSSNWKKFIGRLKQEYGDAGILAGHELETKFRHNIDGMGDAIADIHPVLDRLNAKIKQVGENDAFEKFARQIRNFEGGLIRVKGPLDDMNRSTLRLTSMLLRLKDRDPFGKWHQNLDKLADGMGDAFGRGSRNNFLNLIGAFARGATRIFSLPTRVLQGLSDAAAKVATKFVDAGGGLQGFASLVTMTIPIIVGGSVALASMVLIAGMLVTALGDLAGIIIALASSISFGLIGALAPLFGLLAPLSFGLGAVATAFIGMSDAQKKALKEAVDPLRDGLNDLGDAARPGILDGITRAAKNLRPVLHEMEPLFREVGDAVGNTIAQFAHFFETDQFSRFLHTMEQQAPSVIERLGTAFRNTFAGITEIFTTLNLPGGPVDVFLDWLVKITQEFKVWTRTKDGRDDLVDFFDDAADSADSLWTFIGGVWDVIQKLFSAGKGTGDDMLTSLGDTLSEWADSLSEEDLNTFFDNAKEFADNIGELATALADLVRVLSSPEAQKALDILLALATISFDGLASGIENVQGHLDELSFVSTGVSGAAEWVKGIFVEMGDELQTGWHWLQDQWNKIDWGGIFDFKNIFSGFGNRFGMAGLISPFNGLGGKIEKAIGSISLPKVDVSGVLSRIMGAFPTASEILSHIGNIGILSKVDIGGVVSKVLGVFPTASEILAHIGNINIPSIVDVFGIAQTIYDAFPTADEVLSAIGTYTINIVANIDWPDPPGWLDKITASGGIFAGAQTRIIGEAGAEAVVPLHRPLSMVDPSVRALSAFAQGKTNTIADNGPRTLIDVGGIEIITPTENPTAVARETINQLVAAAYF